MEYVSRQLDYPRGFGKDPISAPTENAQKPEAPRIQPQATPITGVVVPDEGKKKRIVHYEERFADQIVDFFKATPLFREITETITWKDGTTSEKTKEVGNPPPLFEEYAESLGVSVKTLKKWATIYPDFAESVMICEGIIKKFVITHGLGGSYNSQFAIFAAKNITDMKDKTINENRTVNVNELLDQIESSEKPLFEDPNA